MPRASRPTLVGILAPISHDDTLASKIDRLRHILGHGHAPISGLALRITIRHHKWYASW
jgi:hypothetical protein